MAGHSRLKDGVASARLCPAINVFLRSIKNVDARDICAKTRFALLPGHDERASDRNNDLSAVVR
jgi:hypothetical protein